MATPQQDERCSPGTSPSGVARVIPAMSTPLASIFGSGFLVVVPVLASAVGPYAILAIMVVALVAHQVGAIVRHNILCAEPVLAAGSNRLTTLFERISDVALIGAYVVSVCLYVHIMTAFVLGWFGLDSAFNKSLMTTAIIAAITLIGMAGGLAPLEKLERWALYLTLVILAALLVGFGFYDVGQLFGQGSFDMPRMPDRSLWEIVTIVAGTLIIVQGFETTRYLGEHFDRDTRIRAACWSQYLSLSVYVVFVALAQPLVVVLDGVYSENSLITLAGAVSVLLPVPLILAAGLSQFSAAVADTLAAVANMRETSRGRIAPRWGYRLDRFDIRDHCAGLARLRLLLPDAMRRRLLGLPQQPGTRAFYRDRHGSGLCAGLRDPGRLTVGQRRHEGW